MATVKRSNKQPKSRAIRPPRVKDDNTVSATTRKLTLEQKIFIVHGFAQYLNASQIADRLQEEYGIAVLRQHVARYNPNAMVGLPSNRRNAKDGSRATGKTFGQCKVERGTRPDIGDTWQDVFNKERALVDDNPFYVPISRRTVRLGYVDRKVRRLDKLDDPDSMEAMGKFLSHAMKEMGGGGGNGPNVQMIQAQVQAQGNTLLQSEDYQRAMAELAEKLSRRPDVMLALLPGDIQEKVIEIAKGVAVGAENGQAVISEEDK